jgi:hypothetical protein
MVSRRGPLSRAPLCSDPSLLAPLIMTDRYKGVQVIGHRRGYIWQMPTTDGLGHEDDDRPVLVIASLLCWVARFNVPSCGKAWGLE